MTPVEKVGIRVVDAPFVAIDADILSDAVTFTTNVGDRVTAGPDNLITLRGTPDAPRPYVHVRAGLEALIDRKTFYLHYKSIEDLTVHKTNLLLERILLALCEERRVRSVQEPGHSLTQQESTHIVLSELNTIIISNLTMFQNIAAHTTADNVLHRIDQAAIPTLLRCGLSPEIATNPHIRLRMHFFIAGVVSIYLTWLRSDHSQPIEAVSNSIEEAILAVQNAESAPARAGSVLC